MSTDNPAMSSLCAWTRLFHPRGPQVTLPLPTDPKACLEAVNAALDVGWLVQAPGLEEGEEKEQVAFVVHGEFERDGKETPFVLLYSGNDAMKHSFLKVYLNHEADVAAFEYASKMKLSTIETYIGQDKPERGKSRQIDRYIVAPPKPFGVVFKANPKYDTSAAAACRAKGDIYSVPKRVFVRWADVMPQTPAEADPLVTQQELEELDQVIDAYERCKQVRINMERFLGAFAGPECRVASQLRRSQWANAVADLKSKMGAA